VLKPDRKNGMLMAERSNAELLVKVSAILLSVILLLYYYFDELNWWNWIISLFFIWLFVEAILQLTVRNLLERMHNSSENKKYYFRSGVATGSERYNQAEKEKLDTLQHQEPVVFIAVDSNQKKCFYYRFKGRTWVSKEELDLISVKKEINSYLKMKNI